MESLEERIDFETRDKLQEVMDRLPDDCAKLVPVSKNLLGLLLELENMNIKVIEMENSLVKRMTESEPGTTPDTYSKELEDIAEYKYEMNAIREMIVHKLNAAIKESV